jgi:polysaccharide export outer membrane protein
MYKSRLSLVLWAGLAVIAAALSGCQTDTPFGAYPYQNGYAYNQNMNRMAPGYPPQGGIIRTQYQPNGPSPMPPGPPVPYGPPVATGPMPEYPGMAPPPDGGPGPMPIPTEKQETYHPTYIIEPPDVLSISVVRMVPKPPYRIDVLDVLLVQVAETLPNQPINGPFQVSPDGTISLGFGYGTVRVLGLTLDQAANAIRQALRASLANPAVSVGLVSFRGAFQLGGQYLVAQDGSITLGSYGNICVTGLTLCQAKAAIERHLSRFLYNPEISVNVSAYNSKVFYVITDGAGYGEQVTRFPITGKETVLDAISYMGGLPPQSSTKKMWLARPTPCNTGCYQILPINWQVLAQAGDTCTNYQLFPGDRIYIKSDFLICLDNTLAKIFSPIERILGITLLANTTVQSFRPGFFNGNNNGGGFVF